MGGAEPGSAGAAACYGPRMLTALSFGLAAAGPLPLQGGAGLFFNAGGTFMAQPLENTVDGLIVPAQGWGGYGSGGGLALEGRLAGVVGLEVDVVRRLDVARSEFSFTDGGEYQFQIRQAAWHVPILLKLALPAGVVRPNLVGGGELVFPSTPSVTRPDAVAIDVSATAEPYRLWAFGLGFEIVPPALPLDLRFPINLRGAYNTGVGTSAGDRADYTIAPDGTLTAIDYRSAWQWHAAVTAGATVFFP